jgi:diguanylate cyclase (GGDEF)-like protein
MNKIEDSIDEKDFLSNPKIVENYVLLNNIGVIGYVSSLNREIKNYKSLFKCARDIFNRTSVPDILDAVVWQIFDHFLPSFIIFIWKPSTHKDDIAIKGYKNYKQVEPNLSIEGIAGFEPFFMENPRPIYYNLLTSEVEGANVFDSWNPEIVIPILGSTGLYGLVLAGGKLLEDRYNDAELVYFHQLMSFVSQAIQNNLLYDSSLKDVKTGLFNNGFFITRLNEEIARARRNDTATFSIIMIDVDKFKNFNDSFGHLAGDKVLESLALAIKENLRAEDVPSRFGGEEFSVLLPQSDSDGAWVVAERLRKAVASMKLEWKPPLPQVTISLGIYTYNSDTNLSAADMIKRADKALYLSKEKGRNRSTCWVSGLMAKVQQMGFRPS